MEIKRMQTNFFVSEFFWLFQEIRKDPLWNASSLLATWAFVDTEKRCLSFN